MGKEKQTTVVNQTTTPTATPEETELNKLEIERQKALQQPWLNVQQGSLDLISKMLAGGINLPDYANKMGMTIGEDQTSQIVQSSLKDLYPQFQSSGIMDSGVAASVAGRTAADIRRAVAETNIGGIQNLLNLVLSGQAQVQQPLLAQSQILSQKLAGLRSTTTSGQTTQYGMNPFLKSFQTSFGTSLGKGLAFG